MKQVAKATVMLSMLGLLAACGDTGKTTASFTRVDPLNSIQWADISAASSAAKVSNNSLIMMR